MRNQLQLRLFLPLALVVAAGVPAAAAAQDHPPVLPDTAYTPGAYRVFTGAGEPARLEDVVRAMGGHEVVFIGETHDDPTGHMLERELLARAYAAYGAPDGQPKPGAGGETRGAEAASVDAAGGADAGRSRALALSLEAFERDVQLVLDEYLAGLITETAFLADSRPWPRYLTDYRPLVESAKEHGLDVIAANAPRRYVSRVTQQGRAALHELPPAALELLPPLPYGQPSPAYRDQWIAVISAVMAGETMKCGVPVEQPPAHAGAHANMGNQLHSQVLWDASMAYWIARHLDAPEDARTGARPDALVLHVVGGFHVARGTGTPEQLEAYRPGTRAMVVMLRPVADVGAFEAAPAGQWGDFVIQTDEARTLEAIECRS
ncbi:MAG: ChaN family lipoprotein [Gemmatimonadota bacterium]